MRTLLALALLLSGRAAGAAVEPAYLVADTSRLRNEVGWTGETPLDDALDQSIAFEKQRLA